MAGQSRGTGSVPALLSSLNERGARRFVSNTHRSPGRRSVAGWSSYRGSSDSVIVVVVSCLEISPDGRVIALSVLLCSQSPDLAPRLRQLLSRERPPPVGPGRRLKRRFSSRHGKWASVDPPLQLKAGHLQFCSPVTAFCCNRSVIRDPRSGKKCRILQ